MITLDNHTDGQRLPDQDACLSQETLRAYLSGSIAERETERIEHHLTSCHTCESAIRELEREPESFVKSLSGGPPPANGDDPLLAGALERSKELLHASPATNPNPNAFHLPAAPFGAYELLRPLGHGGMGTVYLARHRQLKKTVAIKLLPALSAGSSEAQARFEREVRATGSLNHPAIVTATDAGVHDGTQFLVMEFIAGMDLSHLARAVKTLPVADACEIVRQAALGLSYAHAEAVVHRDVKPSNLMLDETGRVKILDFGLAQTSFWDEASAEVTTVGQLMGTLDYMAPEQAERAGAVDYRADLYSLGATLFRLLCGRAPLAATPHQSPLEKLQAIARHIPPRLDTLRPDAPRELVDLVAELLARDPQARPASAAHVAERLAVLGKEADLTALLEAARAAKVEDEPLPAAKSLLAAVPAAKLAEGRRSVGRWLIATGLLLLPLLFFAGIMIVLETQKGQLVIESDVPDIRVRVVKDGQPVKELEVQTGATSSRLRADKYEIIIDGKSDSVRIDKDHIVIKSGETTIARITEKTPATLATPASPGEPLYDGKPLAHWLEVLDRDKSPAIILSTYDALHAIKTPATVPTITRHVLDAMPNLPVSGRLSPSEGEVHMDVPGLRLVRELNPGSAFYEAIVGELKRGNIAWSERILRRLYEGLARMGSATTSLQEFHLKRLHEGLVYKGGPETVAPLVDWIANDLFGEKKMASSPAIEYYARAIMSQMASTLIYGDAASPLEAKTRNAEADFLVAKLDKSPHLGPEFWLKQRIYPYTAASWRKSVTTHAIQYFTDPKLTPAQVCQASEILRRGHSKDPSLPPELAQPLASHLEMLSKNPERMLARVTAFDSLPDSSQRDSLLRFSGTDFWFQSVSVGGDADNETIAVLKASLTMIDMPEVKAACEKVRSAVAAEAAKVKQQVGNKRVQLTSSDLKVSPTGRGRGGSGGGQFDSGEIDSKVREITPDAWMSFLIHEFASQVIAGKLIDRGSNPNPPTLPPTDK